MSDLEGALKAGRGRLDASTIAVVEHNLQIIDQAINQAREALASDPANSYLSSHLVEARRRKLDLLRRATALAAAAGRAKAGRLEPAPAVDICFGSSGPPPQVTVRLGLGPHRLAA